MSEIRRSKSTDRAVYKERIEAMNDGELKKEIAKVHKDLALVRQTLAELAVQPESVPAVVGPVGFDDAGAVSAYLEEYQAPVINDERQTRARIMERVLEHCESMILQEQRSRARKQAYHDRNRIILEGADILRAAAAVIEKQMDACTKGGIAAVMTGYPPTIEAHIKEAEKFFGKR